MESLQELRKQIDVLAVQIGYHSKISLTQDDEKFVWEMIDFGYKEDLIIQGRASLWATLHFDDEKWEKEMRMDLKRLKKIQNQN